MEDITSLPVYLVVLEQAQFGYLSMRYQIESIIKSIPCDIAQIDDIYAREVAPLHAEKRLIRTIIVYREPENIVRDEAPGE